MFQINLLVINFLLTSTLFAETVSTPEKDITKEESKESYSSDRFYENIQLPPDQKMNFPDPDGGTMYRTKKGATWKGKKGNFDITVSIDDQDPLNNFKTEGRKNRSKDNSKRKKD